MKNLPIILLIALCSCNKSIVSKSSLMRTNSAVKRTIAWTGIKLTDTLIFFVNAFKESEKKKVYADTSSFKIDSARNFSLKPNLTLKGDVKIIGSLEVKKDSIK